MLFKGISLNSSSGFYWLFTAAAALNLWVQNLAASAFGLSEILQPTFGLLGSSRQQLGNKERSVQREMSSNSVSLTGFPRTVEIRDNGCLPPK